MKHILIRCDVYATAAQLRKDVTRLLGIHCPENSELEHIWHFLDVHEGKLSVEMSGIDDLSPTLRMEAEDLYVMFERARLLFGNIDVSLANVC